MKIPEQYGALKSTELGDVGSTEGLRAEDLAPVIALPVDLPLLAILLFMSFVHNYMLNDYC